MATWGYASSGVQSKAPVIGLGAMPPEANDVLCFKQLYSTCYDIA